MSGGAKHDEQFLPRVQLSPAELTTLWRARLDAGIGMRRLARQIGVTVTAFNNYESGARKVPEEVLLRWRAALDGEQ